MHNKKSIRPTERNAINERLEWKMCIFIRFVRRAESYFFSRVVFLLKIVFTFIEITADEERGKKIRNLCCAEKKEKQILFLNKNRKVMYICGVK